MNIRMQGIQFPWQTPSEVTEKAMEASRQMQGTCVDKDLAALTVLLHWALDIYVSSAPANLQGALNTFKTLENSREESNIRAKFANMMTYVRIKNSTSKCLVSVE